MPDHPAAARRTLEPDRTHTDLRAQEAALRHPQRPVADRGETPYLGTTDDTTPWLLTEDGKGDGTRHNLPCAKWLYHYLTAEPMPAPGPVHLPRLPKPSPPTTQPRIPARTTTHNRAPINGVNATRPHARPPPPPALTTPFTALTPNTHPTGPVPSPINGVNVPPHRRP
jgi:hypothetical protein